MQVLSNPTLGLIVEIAAAQFTGSDLKTMLMRANLWDFAEDKAMTNKQELVRSRVLSARNYVDLHDDKDVAQALLNFVRMLVDRTVRYPDRAPEWFGELREALLADGYELRWELEDEGGDDWDPPRASRYQILPTDVSPIPLGPQLSALEAELRGRGYDEALNHYRQAAEAFARHDHEAANSQLRTALESLVVRLANDHTGYVRPPKAGDGWNAIKHLAGTAALAAAKGGDMLKGLWAMSHTKGSHPGRSDADETRFRLHAITATARLLLHRFPARS